MYYKDRVLGGVYLIRGKADYAHIINYRTFCPIAAKARNEDKGSKAYEARFRRSTDGQA
jgi:hypothetical protein